MAERGKHPIYSHHLSSKLTASVDEKHKLYVQEAQTLEPEVVLIGDSIIQQMQISSLWNEKFCSLHCLNFGIGGDRYLAQLHRSRAIVTCCFVESNTSCGVCSMVNSISPAKSRRWYCSSGRTIRPPPQTIFTRGLSKLSR